MSRTVLPLVTGDISQFAKALRAQLSHVQGLPSHVQLLNMICRAAGQGNYQSFRANAISMPAAEPHNKAVITELQKPPFDVKAIQRVARCFGADRRLLRWPARRSDQVLALWGLWASIPSQTRMSEREVSSQIRQLHQFGDHALLRRELCDLGLLVRTPDGSIYRRVEKPLPEGVATLLVALGAAKPARTNLGEA